jgi:ubiquinone/menaquinone biosynthesis C-methylase UbiE
MTAVEIATGQLYGSIWNFMDEQAFAAFAAAHWNKFRHAGLGEDFLEGRTCLDAGSGSGRAVRSMLQDGAAKVFAIDVGEECVRNTRERNASWGDRLVVEQGSVLALPFPDNMFDFVHCDGVLHHTSGPFAGFRELVRVAKPGAPIMFGLYGAGGFLNLGIYTARAFRQCIRRPLVERALRLITRDPVKIYVFLDPLYVPIREVYRPREVAAWASRVGMEGLRRLEHRYNYRGIDRLLKDYNSFGRWFRGDGYLTYIGFKSNH